MEKKLEQAFKKIFPKFKGKFNDKVSPRTYSDWDSLNHLNLINLKKIQIKENLSVLCVTEKQTVKKNWHKTNYLLII